MLRTLEFKIVFLESWVSESAGHEKDKMEITFEMSFQERSDLIDRVIEEIRSKVQKQLEGRCLVLGRRQAVIQSLLAEALDTTSADDD